VRGPADVRQSYEQPRWRQFLTLRPDNGFLLTKEEQYDRAALARCVRLATQNAYLTLQSQLVKPRGGRSKVARGKRRTVDRLDGSTHPG